MTAGPTTNCSNASGGNHVTFGHYGRAAAAAADFRAAKQLSCMNGALEVASIKLPSCSPRAGCGLWASAAGAGFLSRDYGFEVLGIRSPSPRSPGKASSPRRAALPFRGMMPWPSISPMVSSMRSWSVGGRTAHGRQAAATR